MLQGRYSTLFLSIALHVLLLLLLFVSNLNNHSLAHFPKVVINPIKSYLYIKPAIKEFSEPVVEPITPLNENLFKQPNQITQPSVTPALVNIELEADVKNDVNIPPHKSQTLDNSLKNNELHLTIEADISSNNVKYSAYEQLQNLEYTINQKIMKEELAEYRRFRSASVMHKNLLPVPHSTVKLSAEEKNISQTIHYSGNAAMTKRDDGTCILDQDLSNAAMSGLTSRQYFLCGESTFDKNFRLHMQSVKDKLSN